MNYRIANINDASKLDDLLTKLIKDEKENYDDSLELINVKDFYKNIIVKDNTIIYICEYKDLIIGYIYCFINNEKAVIDALFVEENYRNNGVASKLISLIKEYIKEKNIKNIEISVLSENKSAKSLYTKFGFKTFKEVMKTEL